MLCWWIMVVMISISNGVMVCKWLNNIILLLIFLWNNTSGSNMIYPNCQSISESKTNFISKYTYGYKNGNWVSYKQKLEAEIEY